MTRCGKFCNLNIIKNALTSQEREFNSTWKDVREVLWKAWHSSRQRQEQGSLFWVHGQCMSKGANIGYIESFSNGEF